MSASSVAEAYDHHVGRYGAQLAAGLMEVAGVGRGQRALDVGCGPGPLTAALAELLGAEHVAAVDPSEPFVEACRVRCPAPRCAWEPASGCRSPTAASTWSSPSSWCS